MRNGKGGDEETRGIRAHLGAWLSLPPRHGEREIQNLYSETGRAGPNLQQCQCVYHQKMSRQGNRGRS